MLTFYMSLLFVAINHTHDLHLHSGDLLSLGGGIEGGNRSLFEPALGGVNPGDFLLFTLVVLSPHSTRLADVSADAVRNKELCEELCARGV